MRTTLLLIRHGQTSWNALGKIQGCTDIALEPSGIYQAELLSKRLDGNFTQLYTSPLKRAYETAQILGKPNGLNPIPNDDLSEINFGSWEGLTFKEVAARFPADYKLWRLDPVLGPMTDGEGSLKNCSERGKKIMLDLVKKHPGETIAVVSHGGFIKTSLLGLFDLPMTLYHQIAMGNTCLTTIRFDEDLHPVLMGLNDTSHLASLEVTSV